MENEKFHSDIDQIFESYLKVESTPKIKVAKDGKIITKMNYSKVFFDSDLNIYKKNENGDLVQILDPSFSSIIIAEK